ncbi:hypothetical protein [Nocardioides sp. B-3]|uniref:hypothetical protein n=1 Tax=Nocardioides sp. B-3 TaxID=2895565 RepID=UPI0021531F62|nr:hypothetical protein [Nocardioides sp. B-3]UUZ59574.1 hypothetical protein LP418_28075 [Nocardioides sp. B-3]
MSLAQVVITAPALLFLLMLIVQFGLMFHALATSPSKPPKKVPPWLVALMGPRSRVARRHFNCSPPWGRAPSRTARSPSTGPPTPPRSQ